MGFEAYEPAVAKVLALGVRGVGLEVTDVLDVDRGMIAGHHLNEPVVYALFCHIECGMWRVYGYVIGDAGEEGTLKGVRECERAERFEYGWMIREDECGWPGGDRLVQDSWGEINGQQHAPRFRVGHRSLDQKSYIVPSGGET